MASASLVNAATCRVYEPTGISGALGLFAELPLFLGGAEDLTGTAELFFAGAAATATGFRRSSVFFLSPA